jgi:hypothetical protein
MSRIGTNIQGRSPRLSEGDDTEGRRAPQHNHQAADVATVSLWLPCRDCDESQPATGTDYALLHQ